MTDITPLTVFSSAGERNTDGLTLANGFPASQKPKRQWFNWLLNSLTAKVNELVAAVNALQNADRQLPINAIVEIDQALTAEAFATLIGYGTWVIHGAGRVIVGAGSVTIDYSAAVDDAARANVTETFSVGDTGGEIDHKQTKAELANHRHPIMEGSGTSGGGGQVDAGPVIPPPGNYNDSGESIGEVGESAPMNVMQPYIVASRFKRTA